MVMQTELVWDLQWGKVLVISKAYSEQNCCLCNLGRYRMNNSQTAQLLLIRKYGIQKMQQPNKIWQKISQLSDLGWCGEWKLIEYEFYWPVNFQMITVGLRDGLLVGDTEGVCDGFKVGQNVGAFEGIFWTRKWTYNSLWTCISYCNLNSASII